MSDFRDLELMEKMKKTIISQCIGESKKLHFEIEKSKEDISPL